MISIRQLNFFFTQKIWYVNDEKYSPLKRYLFNSLKKLVITIECFINKNINSHASALTYSTILATVPILAIIFAIGRGFGYGSIIENEIRTMQKLGIPMVVEGVEKLEQSEEMERLGVEYIQGDYYGKPLPEMECLRYIRNFNSAPEDYGR